MVSFQKMENGVEEDLKIHFDSTLKVKKKHTGKSENLTVGGKRAFFFPAGENPDKKYGQ